MRWGLWGRVLGAALFLVGSAAGTARADRLEELSPSDLKAAMDARSASFLACYETSARRKAGLGGKVVVRVVLASGGKVTAATVASTTLADPAAEACLVKAVAKILFPPPDMEGWTFTYPFVFAPDAGASPPPPPPPDKKAKKKVMTYGDDGKPRDGTPIVVDPDLEGIEHESVVAPPPKKPGFGKKLPPPGPAVKVGVVDVSGSLDKEIISRVVKKHTATVRYCYEKALVLDPALAGVVTVRFVIGVSGDVTSATIAKSTLGSPSVEGCVTLAVKRWVFPKPAGGIVTVNYPFRFATDGSASVDPLPAEGAGVVLPPIICGSLLGEPASITVASSDPSVGVEDALCRKIDALRTCLVALRAGTATPSGVTTIAYTIGPTGAMAATRVKSSTFSSVPLDACFVKVLRSVSVPASAGKERRERTLSVIVEREPPDVD